MAAAESPTAVTNSQPQPKSIWLNSWYDPVAGLKTYSGCICLADLYADGDSKLLVADMDRKLKVYKGSTIISEHALLGRPVALCSFYTDMHQPKTPAIAVASGPYVFIYRNLRPYYKFTLPAVEISAKEKTIWEEFRLDSSNCDAVYDQLNAARDAGTQLSSRSLDLLALTDREQREDYMTRVKETPLVQQSITTCMSTLNKSMEEKDAISCLVIGTESKQVLILDPQGSTIISRTSLPGTPVMLSISGLYDVDYRIVVSCRNGSIYTIKNGEVMGNAVEMETQPCGLVRLEKSIIVAGTDNTIHSFHFKGKKNWTMVMDRPITNLEALDIRRARQIKGFLVALTGGTIHLFNEKHKISTLETEGTITGMRFGQFGREESTLVLVHKSGAITVKMLQRNANLEVTSVNPGPPIEQDIPLNIPKKTKLYVEQTQRERDQAVDMHRIFQKDLCRLRLTTARAYVKIITDGQGSLAISSGASIRLNAQVQGLGPYFKIKLNLQNGGTKPLMNLPITFGYNHELYQFDKTLIIVPLVIPGVSYVYDVNVRSVSETGMADAIIVYVCNMASCVPVVSAIVNMPVSEQLLD